MRFSLFQDSNRVAVWPTRLLLGSQVAPLVRQGIHTRIQYSTATASKPTNQQSQMTAVEAPLSPINLLVHSFLGAVACHCLHVPHTVYRGDAVQQVSYRAIFLDSPHSGTEDSLATQQFATIYCILLSHWSVLCSRGLVCACLHLRWEVRCAAPIGSLFEACHSVLAPNMRHRRGALITSLWV